MRAIRSILLATALGAIVVAAAGLTVQLEAMAGYWDATNLDIVTRLEDSMRNYDFTTQSVSSSNCDFPVTMLFKNGAEIDQVKNAYVLHGWVLPGGSKNGRLNDGGRWVWDTDKGVKTIGWTRCCHMRLYADSDDHMYNTDWGYYIFGTTHYDYEEGDPDVQWFGKSEDAEAEAAAEARDIWGSGNVFANNADFKNYEAYRVQAGTPPGGSYQKHIWQSSGRRTTVSVQ